MIQNILYISYKVLTYLWHLLVSHVVLLLAFYLKNPENWQKMKHNFKNKKDFVNVLDGNLSMLMNRWLII